MSVHDHPAVDLRIPDLSSYRAVHTAIRLAPHRLARAVRTVDVADPAEQSRIRALGRYWVRFATEVHTHHTLEDDVFFPQLVARVACDELIVRTNADHEVLDDLMTRSSAAIDRKDYAAVAPILDELAHHMDAHLDFEDAEILPLFEQHFTHDEYAQLEEVALKSNGLGLQAAFTVPFILASQSEEELANLRETAPVPLRILYRLTKKRYARLDRLVFGENENENEPLPQPSRKA